MPAGTHEYIQDPRNENVLIYINGDILPRPEAEGIRFLTVVFLVRGWCLGRYSFAQWSIGYF